MINSIESYWLSVVTSTDTLITFVSDFFPPGTNIHATVALNEVNTVFFGNVSNPTTFAVTTEIRSWTVYNPDGSESGPIGENFGGSTQNAVSVDNCARITVDLFGEFVAATAQLNIYRL